jgi:arginyl-tRNA synthetase
MTPDQLADAVLTAAKAVLADHGLDPRALPAAKVERPKNPEHGDYASTIALQAAKRSGLPARELATAIAGKLAGDAAIGSVEVAGPGFLNIRLTASSAGVTADIIVRQGSRYGHSAALGGSRINVEFVSANPTGPIHLGGTRWAAVGDALARILRAQGAAVATEYYFNDAGTQIDQFGRSLLAAARQEPVPEDGYAGEYIGEIAQALTDRYPQILTGPASDALDLVRTAGVELMFAEIKTSLSDFGVHFDSYFSERDLHEHGDLDRALARLEELGKVYQAGEATWIRTSDNGDDKDRVFRRGNGQFTYFAADCAYYLDKRVRGFDKVMIVLGADHHGYVGRMRAVAACFGDDPDRTLEILIGQLVSLISDGRPVRMSKRAGTVITIDDLVGALGVDAARYALARYSLDSPIDLDLDLWTRRSTDNPVYYVQYAHARIASLMRNSAGLGFTLGEDYDASLLGGDREQTLLRALADFPGTLASAAELRQPHRIARYLEDLSGSYHRFHDTCRVLPRAGEEFDETGRARLWLARASQIVLANGLDLLGVSAPDRL